jgi:hypothetical protein
MIVREDSLGKIKRVALLAPYHKVTAWLEQGRLQAGGAGVYVHHRHTPLASVVRFNLFAEFSQSHAPHKSSQPPRSKKQARMRALADDPERDQRVEHFKL